MKSYFAVLLLLLAPFRVGAQTQAQPELVLQSGHSSSLTALEFSPDGRFFVSATSNQIKVWQARDGALLRSFEGDIGTSRSLSFSPDGSQFVAANNQKATLWSLGTGKTTRFLASSRGITHVLWLPDGRIAGTQGRDVFLWNLRNGQRFSLPNPAKMPPLPSVVGDYEGSSLLQCDKRGTKLTLKTPQRLTTWNLQTRRVAQVLPLSADEENLSVPALSPDGTRLASPSGNDPNAFKNVTVWNLTTRKVMAKWKLAWVASGVRFSRNGRFLVATDGESGALHWHDLQSGKVIRALQVRGQDGSGGGEIALSPDGFALATGGFSTGAVKIWRNAQAKAPLAVVNAPAPIATLFSMPQKNSFGWAQNNNALYLWSLKNGVLTRFIGIAPRKMDSFIVDVAAAPDGKTFFIATETSLLCLDSTTGRPKRPATPLPGSSTYRVLALSPDGSLLATGGFAGVLLRLWDAKSGKEIVFRAPLPPATRPSEKRAYLDKWRADSLAFSPDGKWLAMGDSDSARLQLFDVKQRRIVREFDGFRAVTGEKLGFSPDNRLLFASGEPDAAVFDVASRTRLWTQSETFIAGFGANGALWCGQSNGDFTLRDVRTGVVQRRISVGPTSQAPYPSLLLSPDGRFFIGKGDDEVVRIWDTESGTLRLSLCNPPLPDRASPH